MTIALRQSTASQEIPLGYMLDSLDGNTEEVALTIANTDIKLWKHGATTLANKTSGGATHISNGIYYAVLDATDTDTVGSLIVFCHVSGALAIKQECQVYEEAVFDALYASGASGYLQPTTAGRTLDVTATGAAGIDWGNVENPSTTINLSDTTVKSLTSVAANGISASSLATDAVAEIADAVWDEAMSGHLTAGSTGNTLNAVGTVSSNLSSLISDIGTNGAGLTALPWNAAWDAEVQSEVQDAIEVNHLDHLLAVDYDPASKPGVATALLNELIESDSGVSRYTANALEQAPTGGSAPTVGQIADAVWDEVLSGHLTSGTTGNALNAAGSAGDPWSTTLPGAYTGAQAGKVLSDVLVDTGTTLDALIQDVPTVAEFEARTLPSASYFDPAADTVSNVTTVASVSSVAALAANSVNASALATDAVTEIVNAILSQAVDGTITVAQLLRIIPALVSKSSTVGSTVKLRNPDDTLDRVTLVVDANNDRTSSTLNLT